MNVEEVVRMLCLGRDAGFFLPPAVKKLPSTSGGSSGDSLLDKLTPSRGFFASLFPPSSWAKPGVFACFWTGNRTVIVDSLVGCVGELGETGCKFAGAGLYSSTFVHTPSGETKFMPGGGSGTGRREAQGTETKRASTRPWHLTLNISF